MIDNIVYAMVVFSALWGAWRGIFASFFGIGVLVLAFFIAYSHSSLLASSLVPLLGGSLLAPLAASLLVFITVFLLLGLVARLIVAGFKKIDIGGLDFLGGAVFGVLRGGIFAIFFVLMLSAVGVQQSNAWKQSKTVPLLGVALKQSMALPLMTPYANWLRFDERQRPVLVDGRVATAAPQKEQELKANEEPPNKEQPNKDQPDKQQAVQNETNETLEKTKPKKEKKLKVKLKPNKEQPNKQRAAKNEKKGALEKTQSYNEDLDDMMDELADYVAIKSPHSPTKDDIYREERSGDVQVMLQQMLCLLLEKQDCQQ